MTTTARTTATTKPDDRGTSTVRCALLGLAPIVSAPPTESLSGGRTPLPYSHAGAIAAIPGATVVAICDLQEALRSSFVEQWGDTWPEMTAYRDVDEMLDREEIDILAVATPDNLHTRFVVQAAEQGIPAIMCEKPLATSLTDADTMIAALDANGTLCSVDHTRRWDPYFHRVKQLIDDGAIGEVRTIVATLTGERAMLFRNGTHSVDLMNYYAGGDPARIFGCLEDGYDDFTAYRGDGGHDPASEPSASAVVLYANGVRGFFNATRSGPSTIEWDVWGTDGRIRISGTNAELWTRDSSTGELVQRAFPAGMRMRGGLQGAYEELIDALRNGGPLRSTPRDARKAVAVLQGILDSNQRGGCLVDADQGPTA